jgi:hypothetical protein
MPSTILVELLAVSVILTSYRYLPAFKFEVVAALRNKLIFPVLASIIPTVILAAAFDE